uniref:Skp1-related protein n=1 Tax=Rhabditophanes sp. KR3021 TaxID=114890 RepID=A0AC35TJT9_9BILA
MSAKKTLPVSSEDGDDFELSMAVVQNSGCLKQMALDLNIDLESDEPINCERIDLTALSSKMLEFVSEYCQFHQFLGEVPHTKDENDEYDSKLNLFTDNFIKKTEEFRYELIMAANFLDISSLLTLGCDAAADTMKGKTTEQLREYFGLEDDFTEAEKEFFRNQNKWVDE